MTPETTFVGPGALPKEPTDAAPGSEQKILVMIERAARREQLFHPLDGLGRRGGLSPEARRWPLPTCEPFDLEELDLDEEDLDEEEEPLLVPDNPGGDTDSSAMSFSA